MSTTIVQYKGNGIKRDYIVSFPFLSPAHVRVSVGGFTSIQGAHYDFTTSNTITFRPQFTPPANVVIELRRVTDNSAALVQFQNGAVLPAGDLNAAVGQLLYLTQEIQDNYTAKLEAGLTRLNNGTSASIENMLAAITQEVLSDALLADLQTRYGDIDTNAAGLVSASASITALQNQINALGVIGGVGIGTLITNEQTARIAGDSALASTIALIGAKNGGNTAFILDMSKVLVDAYTSLGTTLSGITSSVGSANAAIAAETTARTNADTAISSSVSALTTTVNGHTASISTNVSSINGLSAKYTVKVDNNGYVSGFGLASTSNNGTPTSSFIVLADKFSVVTPGSSPKVPFAVSGGVVYMQNVVIGSAIISDLAIGKLTTGTLNADMNMGTGKIIWSNGAYMKVAGVGFGSSSQFIEWFGPYKASLSSCTEANAISYLKTTGSAYFGGTLLAGVLSNSVQATILNNTNVADLGPYASNGGTITITWSYVFVGTTSFPGTSSGLTAYNGVTKGSPSAQLILSRSLNGAAFVDVATLNISNGGHFEEAPIPAASEAGFYQQSMSGSGTYTDNGAVAQTREYKLRINSWTGVNSQVRTNTLSIQSVE